MSTTEVGAVHKKWEKIGYWGHHAHVLSDKHKTLIQVRIASSFSIRYQREGNIKTIQSNGT